MRGTFGSTPLLVLYACAGPGAGAADPDRFVVPRDLTDLREPHHRAALELIAAADAWAGGDREGAAAHLSIAAATTPQPGLAAHLRAAHRAWTTGGDLEALEETLLAGTGRPLIAPFAPLPGEGPALRVVQVGIVEEREQDVLDHLLARLDAFESWLGLAGGGARAPRDGVVVARLLARAGAVDPGEVRTLLPADPARRASSGSLSVFWRAMLREREWVTSVAPAARAALAEEDAARVTAAAHLRWRATRAVAGQVGPELDRKVFGAHREPLSTAKADALGVLARCWLAEEGEVDPLEVEQAACTLVAMAFHALADARRCEGSTDGRAAALEVVWLLEHGAIALQGSRVSVDAAATVDAARSLAREIATLAVQRDAGRAAALLARGERLPAGIETALRRVVSLPRIERRPEFRWGGSSPRPRDRRACGSR